MATTDLNRLIGIRFLTPTLNKDVQYWIFTNIKENF
jgi:hypothetical protein